MSSKGSYSNVVVVTGANRGLGLGFVEEFCLFDNHPAISVIGSDSLIIATCRDPANATKLIALQEKVGNQKLIISKLDITNADQIEEFRQFMENEIGRLDLLLNNAGVIENELGACMANFDAVDAMRIMQTNAIAPVMLTQSLLPLLQRTMKEKKEQKEQKSALPEMFPTEEELEIRSCLDSSADAGVAPVVLEKMLYVSKGGKRPTSKEMVQGMDMLQRALENTFVRVVFISSSMSSIAVVANSASPSYRASKAALNMYIRCFSKEYPEVAFLALHPGWVQTDMGCRGDRTPPTEISKSIRGCLKMVNIMNVQDSGKYLEAYDQTIWPF